MSSVTTVPSTPQHCLFRVLTKSHMFRFCVQCTVYNGETMPEMQATTNENGSHKGDFDATGLAFATHHIPVPIFVLCAVICMWPNGTRICRCCFAVCNVNIRTVCSTRLILVGHSTEIFIMFHWLQHACSCKLRCISLKCTSGTRTGAQPANHMSVYSWTQSPCN